MSFEDPMPPPDRADPHDPQNHMRLLIRLNVKMDQIEGRISLIFWLVGALFLAWTIEVIEEFHWPF